MYLLNSACAAVRDNKATNMPTHKSLLPGRHRLFHFPSIADNDLAVDLARVCSFPFLKRATANGQIKGEQCGPANGVSERGRDYCVGVSARQQGEGVHSMSMLPVSAKALIPFFLLQTRLLLPAVFLL